MKYYLAVEVEHVRYARFLPLDQAGKRSLELTTLVDEQRKAEVHIYLLADGQRTFLHTFTVSSLPRAKAGEPRLTLRGSFDGKHTATLQLEVNGRRHSSEEISLRRHLPRKRRLLPLLIALLIVILAGGGWLLLRSCLTGPAPGPVSGTEPATRETERQQEESAGEAGETYAAEEDTAAAGPAEDEAKQQETGAVEEPAPEEETAAAGPAEEEEPEEGDGAEAAVPELDATIYFDPDSPRLTAEGRQQLRELLPELEEAPGEAVVIAGHCALYGTEQGRMDLSAERARAVYRYLRQQGWSPEEEPSLRWYGGKRPVTTARDEQQLNRRVEIRTETGGQE